MSVVLDDCHTARCGPPSLQCRDSVTDAGPALGRRLASSTLDDPDILTRSGMMKSNRAPDKLHRPDAVIPGSAFEAAVRHVHTALESQKALSAYL